jgi:hypothetical protein
VRRIPDRQPKDSGIREPQPPTNGGVAVYDTFICFKLLKSFQEAELKKR